MRMAWAMVAVVLVGCPPATARHVFVPKSSAPCWRECKAQSIECLKTRSSDPFAQSEREKFCEDERNECLLTCDGAREEAAVPVR